MSAPRTEHAIHEQIDGTWRLVGRYFGSNTKNVLRAWIATQHPKPGLYRATKPADGAEYEEEVR